jgi:hypothetical protein
MKKVFFIVLIVTFLLALLPMADASAVGLAGYQYRQRITLTGTTAGSQAAGYNKSFKVVYADPWWTTGPKDGYTPLGLKGFGASDWSTDGAFLYALKDYHVYRSSDNGITFIDIATVPAEADPHPVHAGKGMCCFVDSQGHLFVGFGSTRKLYRCAIPSTASSINDFKDINNTSGAPVLVIASGNYEGYTDDGFVFNLAEDGDGILYATTYCYTDRIESRVVKSTDWGLTWNKCRALKGALDWDTSENTYNEDLTTNINDSDVGDARFFQDLTTNDDVRFCFYQRTSRMTVHMATAGEGTYTCNWWYWAVNLANPAGTWVLLSGVDAVDSTGVDKANGEYFKATGEYEIYWTLPTDWEETIFGGITGYWVRCYINSGAPTTSPVATQAWSASSKSFVARHMHLTRYSSTNDAIYVYSGEWTAGATVSDMFSDNTELISAMARDNTVYTDETMAALNNVVGEPSTQNDMNLLPASPVDNEDGYYFGFKEPSRHLDINVGTAGVGTWTITWWYYRNDSTWQLLSGVTPSVANFDQWKVAGVGTIEWTMPTDWASSSVGGTTAYWVSAYLPDVTPPITTQPKGTQVLSKVAESCFLWKTKDAGNTWEKVSVYPKMATAICCRNDYVYIGEELLDGTANQIFRLQDQGSGPYNWTSVYTLPTGYAAFSSIAVSSRGAMVAGTYAEAGLAGTNTTLYIVTSPTGESGTWKVIARHQLVATWNVSNAYLGWPTYHAERADGKVLCSIGSTDLAGAPQSFFLSERSLFNTVFTLRKCQTDFDDVRLTRSDGVTLVPIIKNPYESTNSQEAEFWCQLPVTTPTNGVTQTYYVYYGNPQASAPTWKIADIFSGREVAVVVGAGGAGHLLNAVGGNGGNSSFGTTIAIGGGGGNVPDANPGIAGGSGGGGGAASTLQSTGGAQTNGTPNGGTEYNNDGGGNGNYRLSPYASGGGGGAGAVGGSGTATGICGNGGAGVDMSSHFGTSVGVSGWFGGGGGGSNYAAGGTEGTASSGGGAGGGNGGNNGAAGTANTGGGGGGARNGYTGGAGGSGVVIVKDAVGQTVFTASGTYHAPPGTTTVELLVVAAGGGGSSGGGGAGEVIYDATYDITEEDWADDWDDGHNQDARSAGYTSWTSVLGTWTATSGGLPSSGYFVRTAGTVGQVHRQKLLVTDIASSPKVYNMYYKSTGATGFPLIIKSSATDKTAYDQGYLMLLGHHLLTIYKADGSASSLATINLDANLIQDDTWMRVTASWVNATSGISLGLDGCGYVVTSDATYNSGGCVRIGREASANEDYDWFYMRPTVDWTQYDEPKWTAIGGEERMFANCNGFIMFQDPGIF